MRPFAVIREALDAAQLEALRREADALAAEAPPSVENGCVCEPLNDPQGNDWRIDRAAYVAARKLQPCERVLFEVLPRIAEQHLGSSQVVLFNGHYVVKPPCTSVEFRWHADAELQIPGWSPETCPRYVSCWCALDDCDEANGCLVVKHAGEAVPVRCGAGDVVLLADDCVHSSGANASSSARRAYYAQYSSAPIVAGAGPLRLAIPCPPVAPAPVELPAQRAVLFPELVGAPAPAAAPMDTAPDAPPATPDAVPAATDAVADAGAAGASEAPPAAPDEDAPASPRSGKPAEALAESGRRPTDASPAKTRGATAEPEPEPPAPPKVREHDAHVTIRCGGTKLWCARDARDLLKALAAFNKGAPKEKKTKLKAVRKSRRRS